MANSLVKAVPMLLSIVISILIYLFIDNKFNITSKIGSRIPIKQELKALFCICFVIISILIIGVISIYVIDTNNTLFGLISGTLAGIGSSISVKLSINKTS